MTLELQSLAIPIFGYPSEGFSSLPCFHNPLIYNANFDSFPIIPLQPAPGSGSLASSLGLPCRVAGRSDLELLRIIAGCSFSHRMGEGQDEGIPDLTSHSFNWFNQFQIVKELRPIIGRPKSAYQPPIIDHPPADRYCAA